LHGSQRVSDLQYIFPFFNAANSTSGKTHTVETLLAPGYLPAKKSGAIVPDQEWLHRLKSYTPLLQLLVEVWHLSHDCDPLPSWELL